jgi:hypothetical protein
MFIPTTTLTQGSGATWTNAFTESGSSLANWTQDSGAWSVASGAFHVDATGGAATRLAFTVEQVLAQSSVFCLQADVMMEAASVGTDAPLGLLFHWSGTGSGAPTGQIFKAGAGAGTKQMRAEFDASAAILTAFTPSPTWAFDVYSKLRLVVTASVITMSLGDRLTAVWGITTQQSYTTARKVGLVCNNSVCNFKNITLDYLATPA